MQHVRNHRSEFRNQGPRSHDVDSTAPSTSALVSLPADHLWKSADKILTNVGTIMFREDCIMKLPPLWITLRGKREGGTSTLITSLVSEFRVLRPSSSVAVNN
jgi:hypothetical protein